MADATEFESAAAAREVADAQAEVVKDELLARREPFVVNGWMVAAA